jgi:ribonuclease D
MDESEFVYVDTDQQLVEVFDNCNNVAAIAVDTEFARFNTYYPMVGLVQIYNGQECYLIDPLPINDLSPLAELLNNQNLIKVLHACSEDMEVFQYALGTTPTPVFDTQIASAALGIGFSVGYQSLVEHYLDITLPKDQTRSDWLQRPLSRNQLDYAALDVIHLLQVYEKQLLALEGTPKLDWIEDESSYLGKDIPTLISPEEYYKKVKGLWQLDRQQLGVLKTLCAWREVTARKENVPRNRVIDQKALMIIVKEKPSSKQALQEIVEITPRQVRKFGDEILFLQTEAHLVPERDCPQIVDKPDARVNNKLMKRLRQVVEERARDLSVAPELLIKRRHLEKLIRSEDESGRFHLPGELLGWREAAIGDALLNELSE